jgi:hypothetical protein
MSKPTAATTTIHPIKRVQTVDRIKRDALVTADRVLKAGLDVFAARCLRDGVTWEITIIDGDPRMPAWHVYAYMDGHRR